jgi:phenylpropionate dioxygenase-like ring-hydroxylating dioxygenase large terminal subunit
MKQDGQAGVDGVFSDGAGVEDLIDRKARRVSTRLLADREVFELELASLFARSWIPVAHSSELREPGDFVTRRIGRDPVIVTLDFDGEHRVMLNVCTHRGAQVCRGEAGNARTHTCPFHGWAFGADGKLAGVPFERVIYGEDLQKNQFGLRHARVGVLAGIIFATWDEEAPELEEFMGDYRWYLDAMLCRTDAGLEVLGPPQRFVVNANWKLLVEGAFGDSYHSMTVHRSLIDVGATIPGEERLYGFKASFNGNVVICTDLERYGIQGEPAEVLAVRPPPGMPPELVGELDRHLSSEQIAFMARTPPSVAGIFPSSNLLMLGSTGTREDGPMDPVVNLRFFVPIRENKTEFLSFYLVERDAPQEFKDRLLKSSAAAFGVGGFFEEDDIEVFSSMQRGLEGVIAQEAFGTYQAASEPLDPDPSRPGTAYRGALTDDTQWSFYERIFDFLGGKPW